MTLIRNWASESKIFETRKNGGSGESKTLPRIDADERGSGNAKTYRHRLRRSTQIKRKAYEVAPGVHAGLVALETSGADSSGLTEAMQEISGSVDVRPSGTVGCCVGVVMARSSLSAETM
jgi:hypothetical protein